ncbi:MAG: RIP metalloprotease RseP [Bacteroidales bacterium]|nr:RIP metalloprotease RseP [Bacteroidales bacterium]MBQ6101035.1 RIP metalloprotease RseP [Bacteroidales bacterium]
MVILIKVIQFFLALSILVFVHELGHFLAAKAFKTRVEKFYLFFDWGFSIFRCKKVDGKWRFKFFAKNAGPDDEWAKSTSTEYGIGWFPLGGYNKIAGMIDESMDKEQMKQPAQEWEFRSKPAWQRFIIMVAGVFMNVVLAVCIYIGLLANYGEQYLPTSEVNKYGIVVDSLGYEFGLRDGDKVLSVDGETIENFQEIPMQIILEKAKTIEVERDGQRVVVTLPDDALTKLLSTQNGTFISYRMPFVVSGVIDNSAAQAGGLEVGDVIIGINDIPTPYYQDFTKHIKQFSNQKVDIMVVRDFDTLALPMQLGEQAVIGAYLAPLSEYFTLETKEYTFWQAIPAGFSKTFSEISDYWKQLKLIFSPKTKAYESVGGFISIGKIFPDTWIWSMFWRLTAFLSIALAVMNILPIPALDGGHILFLLYEIITRRKPSDKFMEIAEYIGLALVLALVIFANGNDIIKLFK